MGFISYQNQNLWSTEMNFYFDGTTLVYTTNPMDQTMTPAAYE